MTQKPLTVEEIVREIFAKRPAITTNNDLATLITEDEARAALTRYAKALMEQIEGMKKECPQHGHEMPHNACWGYTELENSTLDVAKAIIAATISSKEEK